VKLAAAAFRLGRAGESLHEVKLAAAAQLEKLHQGSSTKPPPELEFRHVLE
jgi:hypothetical protein